MAVREKSLEKKEGELDRMIGEERVKLEQIAGLTAQQARDELIRVLEDEARIEAAHIVKRLEDEARETANKQAQRIIGMAVQRDASDYVSETTVSVVMLPNDEMKGRIIGREGRNIRALEMATGVDLIVDDTPEAVILSGFDPYRREVARVALERLISDGRIHPARIEEVVEKVKAEFEQKILQEGEAALLELGIPGMHPELVKLLGRPRYRTSYGQNVPQPRTGGGGRARTTPPPPPRPPRPAPGAGQAPGTAALPHLLRPERAAAQQGGRLPRRHHGRGGEGEHPGSATGGPGPTTGARRRR